MFIFAALSLMAQSANSDVVVSAPAIRAAQERCLRDNCTPTDDARLSIALADAEFRRGEYLKSRRTLSAAVARNRHHAVTNPKPVATLYQALAVVALHEGDQDVYRGAVRGRVHILTRNLPADDPSVLAAAPAMGDMWTKLGNPRAAEMSFSAAEKRALAAGHHRTAMGLALRRAWLVVSAGDGAKARRMIAEIAARPIARDPIMANVLRVMRVRIAVREGDDAWIALAVRDLSQGQGRAPVLLWGHAFPIDAMSAANVAARKFLEPDPFPIRASGSQSFQWVDVGFWVRPDGSTAEAEILRGSLSPPWANGALAQIAGRRYAAVEALAGTDGLDESGVYRVERITRRSTSMTPTDSRIRRRVPGGDFEVLDLTEAGAVPNVAKSASAPPAAFSFRPRCQHDAQRRYHSMFGKHAFNRAQELR